MTTGWASGPIGRMTTGRMTTGCASGPMGT